MVILYAFETYLRTKVNFFCGKETVDTAETKVNETFCFPFFFREMQMKRIFIIFVRNRTDH